MRYGLSHSNIKFISSPHHVISSMYPSDIAQFSKLCVLQNIHEGKINKHNSLYLVQNMLGYLSLDIICLSKLAVMCFPWALLLVMSYVVMECWLLRTDTNKENVFYFWSRKKRKTYMEETSKGIPSKESGLIKIDSKDLFDFEFRVWSFSWKQETKPSQLKDFTELNKWLLSKLHVPAFESEDWQACREAIRSTDLPPGKKIKS